MYLVARRFIRTLKGEIYKKMMANGSKSYLNYLTKLVDEYNTKSNHSVGKKPANADYSAFSEEIENNPKASKLKVGD